MAENLIERRLRWASRPTHFIYLGDVAKAAEWKQFALKKKFQLLDIGNGSPLSHHVYPTEGTKVSYKTGGLVDIIIIEVEGGGGSGLVIQSDITSIKSEKDWFLPTKDKLPYQIKHIKNEVAGGNIDWYTKTPDGKIKDRISWMGPWGRNNFGQAYAVVTPSETVWFETNFGRNIYRGGGVYLIGPAGKIVFGAAIYKSNVVIAVGAAQGSPPNIARQFSILYVKQSAIPKDGIVKDWLTAGSFSIPFNDPATQPLAPAHIMAFSASGSKFATVWAFWRKRRCPTVLVSGELSIDEHGVITASCVPQSASPTGMASLSNQSVVRPGSTEISEESSSTNTTLMSVDFKGEDMVTLLREYSASSDVQRSLSYIETIGEQAVRYEFDEATGAGYTFYDRPYSSLSTATSSSTISESVTISSSDGAIDLACHRSRETQTDYSESVSGAQSLWANDINPTWSAIGEWTGSKADSRLTLSSEDYFYCTLFCDLRNSLFLYANRMGELSYQTESRASLVNYYEQEWENPTTTTLRTGSTRAQISQVGKEQLFYDRLVVEGSLAEPSPPTIIYPEPPSPGPSGNISYDGPIYGDIAIVNQKNISPWHVNRTGTATGILAKVSGVEEFIELPKIILTDDDPSDVWGKHLLSAHKGAEEAAEILWPLFWV